MKYSKLGSLEKQKKRKAWKFKGRTGDKAQRLRKVGHGNKYAIFSIDKHSQFTGGSPGNILEKDNHGISQNCARYETTIFFHTSPLF